MYWSPTLYYTISISIGYFWYVTMECTLRWIVYCISLCACFIPRLCLGLSFHHIATHTHTYAHHITWSAGKRFKLLCDGNVVCVSESRYSCHTVQSFWHLNLLFLDKQRHLLGILRSICEFFQLYSIRFFYNEEPKIEVDYL